MIINLPRRANADVRFHAWETGVEFPAELLARPLRAPSDGATTSSSPADSQSFSTALGKLLKDRLRYDVGTTSLPLAAEIAELSPRTLQRRLADEGLTYRRLLDRIRFETARELLEDPTVTSNEIASFLDYSGVNNFLRAFRRFTGMTPSAYRQTLFTEADRSARST
jgi:AraC-like DNA-binding protein